jgi:hypothetical protein
LKIKMEDVKMLGRVLEVTLTDAMKFSAGTLGGDGNGGNEASVSFIDKSGVFTLSGDPKHIKAMLIEALEVVDDLVTDSQG